MPAASRLALPKGKGTSDVAGNFGRCDGNPLTRGRAAVRPANHGFGAGQRQQRLAVGTLAVEGAQSTLFVFQRQLQHNGYLGRQRRHLGRQAGPRRHLGRQAGQRSQLGVDASSPGGRSAGDFYRDRGGTRAGQ